MRFLFVLILLAGTGIGLIYPWATANFSGREIGTWRVYEQGRFKPLTVSLRDRDAPVRVLVDLTARAERIVSKQRTVLTLTAATNGHTVLASTLQFNHVDNPRQASPQLPDKIFRDEAGLIATVSPGAYVFTVGPGDAEDIPMRAVDLVLRSGVGEIDGRARPIGFSLMAVGLIGFLLSLRSAGGRPENPNSQPPPPRWGRGPT
ncbi:MULTISPECIES: hypothetical protein [unclassified Mesorhizobium]|uniref:hypothetical protein n=1 Tax=unclassified Mesorhizobium TaxID=325217 RepID=UPI00112AB9A4|nr:MULTISPECIES: hypothetical protein [unclassified Mesorhizobium]MBZ9905106.1 hypothetical protein [Mesorhizobium sp. BR115XR7A]MBZ9933693.1 hypothetical protein [Mesorhizobium sp. BR1-1-5]TPK06916.1 hypothetical protein FJ543_28895 [Mesorhizobium sp. B2-5-7]